MCVSFRARGRERKQASWCRLETRASLRQGTEADREQVGRTPEALTVSDEAEGTGVHRAAFFGVSPL